MATSDYRVPVPDHVKALLNKLGDAIGRGLPPGKALQEFMRAQAS